MKYVLEFAREGRLSEGTMTYADGVIAAIRMVCAYWREGWKLERVSLWRP